MLQIECDTSAMFEYPRLDFFYCGGASLPIFSSIDMLCLLIAIFEPIPKCFASS